MATHRELFDLTGRLAIVTGAGGALGHAVSIGLAEAGADLALFDITDTGLEHTRRAVAALGRQCVAVLCNVGVEDDVDRAFTVVDETVGRVDILVNNAATAVERHRPEAFPLDAWERALRVDLTGYFLCARAAGRRMIAQGDGGSVVNVSSIAGATGLGRGNFAYSVAKGGINQLTRELAIEWAGHGIRVNAILPAQFRNAGWAAVETDPSPASSSLLQRITDGIPLGRLGEPREIVGPVVFLAADASSMVTGALLPVDGGNLALNAGGSVRWPDEPT
ncbi:MAG: SDR family oxidoreductase [Deltaproteobacteria bacterium]|nr:SDR family oxidoreductase [Deltaproteobacteria bacterium]